MADALGHHPDMKDGNGLFCFLNMDRECGPACMAYTTPPEGKDYESQQWANCHILVNLHRGGKHLTILAQTTSKAVADKHRTNQTPVPGVR